MPIDQVVGCGCDIESVSAAILLRPFGAHIVLIAGPKPGGRRLRKEFIFEPFPLRASNGLNRESRIGSGLRKHNGIYQMSQSLLIFGPGRITKVHVDESSERERHFLRIYIARDDRYDTDILVLDEADHRRIELMLDPL
jgi:hypothetical protein